MSTYVIETPDVIPEPWLEENTRQRIEEAVCEFVTQIHVKTMSPIVKDGDGQDVLVLCQAGVVVHVKDVADAPAAAIEAYWQSLADDSMGIRFDCYRHDDE